MKCTQCNIRLVNFVVCEKYHIQVHTNCLLTHITTAHPISSPLASVSPNNFNMNTQSSSQQSLTPDISNFNPLPIRDFAPAPSLPPNWDKMSSDQKSEEMMKVLLEVKEQNLCLKQDIAANTHKVNFHSSVLATHNEDLQRL